MGSPTPLREVEQGPDIDVGGMVAGSRAVCDWPLDRRAASLRAIKARANRAPLRPWAIGLGLAGATAAAVACIALLLRSPGPVGADGPTTAQPSRPTAQDVGDWTVLSLGDLGTIESRRSAPAVLREEAHERQVRLAAGTLRAQIAHQDPRRPVVVLTPHLRIIVVGTRFDVFVDGERTSVDVVEGRIRVERGLGSVLVEAGETIRSDDPRFGEVAQVAAADEAAPKTAPASLAPPPRYARSSIAECERVEPLEARTHCLQRLAGGRGLSAQNAMHQLALLARDTERRPEEALRWWRLYQQRFPSGALGPEVALGMFETCVRERRLAEAVDIAAGFERQFESDPRAPEVALAHAALLCARPGPSREQGRGLLAGLARQGDAAIRKSAMQAQARCGDEAPAWEIRWNALLPRFEGAEAPKD